MLSEQSIHILLVEDNASDARLVQEMIRDSAAFTGEITTVERLRQAQNSLQEASFDIILLDLNLPDSHGYATFIAVKDHVRDTPIVLLTGLDDDEIALKAVKDGAQDYLSKQQIEPALLNRVIRYSIERKHQEQVHRRMQYRMQQVENMESLSTLASGIAHDFNNLLTIIMGNAELVRPYVDGEQAEDIDRIVVSAQDAARLTDQMTAFAGKGDFGKKPVELSEIVRQALHLLQASETDTYTICTELDEQMPPVHGHEVRLQQVLTNLVKNAAEALADGQGTITVRTGVTRIDKPVAVLDGRETRPPGTYAYLDVEDTGCGMPVHVRKRMFEPFFTTKSFGRGLGLAAVQGIVRRHEGAVVVESRVEAGTVVRVLLPIAAEESEIRLSPASDRPVLKGSGTILVIEQKEEIGRLVCDVVRGQGFDAEQADDIISGLEAFRQYSGRLCAVVMDLSISNISEYVALAHFNDGVPIVITGSQSEAEMRLRLEGMSFFYLRKPYHPEALLQVLHKALA